MEPLLIDLTNRSSPPPDDTERAPHGWTWDRPAKEWRPKKRPAFGGYMGRRKEPDAPPPGDDGEAPRGEDPPPAWQSGRAPRAPRAKVKVTAKTKNDISGAVGLVAMALGPPLMAADPYCAGAFFDNLQQITDAVIPLLCRSQKVVDFFSDDEGGDWMLWFKLLIALAPVGAAIGRHHIMRTVELADEVDDKGNLTGKTVVVERDMSEYAT